MFKSSVSISERPDEAARSASAQSNFAARKGPSENSRASIATAAKVTYRLPYVQADQFFMSHILFC